VTPTIDDFSLDTLFWAALRLRIDYSMAALRSHGYR